MIHLTIGKENKRIEVKAAKHFHFLTILSNSVNNPHTFDTRIPFHYEAPPILILTIRLHR